MNIYADFHSCLIRNGRASYTPALLMKKYGCTYQDARAALETAADEGLLAYAGGMAYTSTPLAKSRGEGQSAAETERERDYKPIMNSIYTKFMNEGSASVPELMVTYSLSYPEILDILKEMEECSVAEYGEGMTWKALKRQDPDTELKPEGSKSSGAGLGAELLDLAFSIYTCNTDIQIYAARLSSSPASRDRDGVMNSLFSILTGMGEIFSKCDELCHLLTGIPDSTKDMQETARNCLLLRRRTRNMQNAIHTYLDNPGSASIPATDDFDKLNKLVDSVYSNVLSISDITK
ncbi:MAG: hypothetical protein LUD51_00230 [Clostridia bacterium]|nr:hypothetical protein [Clostridia bacterium]